MLQSFKDDIQVGLAYFKKVKLKKLRCFRPFLFIFSQAGTQKMLHFFANFRLFFRCQAKHRIFDFFLDFPFIISHEIHLLEQQTIGDDSQGPHVNSGRIVFLVKDLRGHERISSKSFIETLLLRCETEVSYLVVDLINSIVKLTGDKDVVGFEVTVANAHFFQIC